MKKSLMPLSELSKFLSYDPNNGNFIWIVKRRGRSGGVNIGDIAGKKTKSGYILIGVSGNEYLAHRLAWVFVHGEWPIGDIDHINGNTIDNRISNLRDVPHKVNIENRKRCQSNNKTGFLGVCFNKRYNKFQAEICHNGDRIYLGRFSTPEEAYEAYIAAKRLYHIGCTI